MAKNKVSNTENDTYTTCERNFADLASSIRDFSKLEITDANRLFTTDVEDLYKTYLEELPEEYRQHHTCHCCRSFIKKFGGLVCITEDATTYSPIWSSNVVPDFYKASIAAMADKVRRAKVTGIFLSSKETLGTPETVHEYGSIFTHFSIKIPREMIYTKRNVLTAGQAMALKRENFKSVKRALSEFPKALLDSAISLLEQEKLNRSEKFVGPVKWLRVLQDRPKGPRGDNLVWKAVSLAPEGYCHPRSSVIGSLLEDIEARLDFASIAKRFADKTKGDTYQRPQVAPSTGNIKAAEDIVEKLGIARSFERRFARIEDIQNVLWKPEQPKEKSEGGFFKHLVTKEAKDEDYGVVANPTVITWEKFARTVLPNTNSIQMKTPTRGHYTGLTTANDADAPPILKWDSEEERNPVAWYVYVNGSQPEIWGLRRDTWVDVNLITPHPTMWGKTPSPHLGEGVILILEGAMDTTSPAACLFPETLKNELFSIRQTIEAHSNSIKLAGAALGNACGYSIRKGSKDLVTVRVKLNNVWSVFNIDRWD